MTRRVLFGPIWIPPQPAPTPRLGLQAPGSPDAYIPAGWMIHVYTGGWTYPEYGGTTDIPLALNGPRCRLQQPGNVYGTGTGDIIPVSPPSYVLEMETDTNFDWQDVVIIVERQSSTTAELTFIINGESFPIDIVAPDGEVAASKPLSASSSIQLLPCTTRADSKATASTMRLRVSASARDTQKVLVLEYNSLVANLVGVSVPDNWPASYAARHNGTLNVLFRDGHAGNLLPTDIDPTVTPIYQASWLPGAMTN